MSERRKILTVGLSDPHVLVSDIVEDLETGFEQFRGIATDLG